MSPADMLARAGKVEGRVNGGKKESRKRLKGRRRKEGSLELLYNKIYTRRQSFRKVKWLWGTTNLRGKKRKDQRGIRGEKAEEEEKVRPISR